VGDVEDTIVGDADADEVDDPAGAGPPNRPPLNQRKVALLVAVAVALCAGGYLIVNANSSRSPGSQLQSAWKSLVASNTKVTGAADLARNASALSTFAVSVGRITFPATDETTAHSVIHDAVAVATDTSAVTSNPARPAIPPSGEPASCYASTTTLQFEPPDPLLCVNFPGYPGQPTSVTYPSNFGSDVSALNRDVQTLFAELGMSESG